jgi:membrane associated rhomboid family serine protease
MTSTPVGMRCPECARQRTRVRTMRSAVAGGDPVLTYALIAVNVIAFIGEVAGGANAAGDGFGGSRLVADGALRASDVANGDYWRLLTAGFLHSGLFHLLVNMYSLYVLGRLQESMWGHVRFLALYLIAGLGGSCAMA